MIINSLQWLVRIVTVVVFGWWYAVILSYNGAANGRDVEVFGCVKLAMFLLLFCIPLWISTTNIGKRWRWLIIWPIVIFFYF